ncbi:MAG: hypothetical protein JNG88_17325, partial [Phycisphaerales bacterium]|nr:hypothetical protein [Phycisphaerales bacterium]
MSRSAFLGFTLLLNFSGLAGTIYVDPVNGNNAWTGLCETYDGAACGPKRTIAAAVAIAVNGDTVQLADGVYRGEGNADLALGGRAITLRGDTAAPSNIVIEFTS